VNPYAVAKRAFGYFCEYALKFSADYGLMAFDGDSIFRYTVYPEYKSRRGGAIPEEESNGSLFENRPMYEALAPVKFLCQSHGIAVVHEPQFEADDILSSAAWMFTRGDNDKILRDRRAYMVTMDKDLFQSVSPTAKIFKPAVGSVKQDMIIGPEEVKALRGFSPSRFLQYQILTGDSIDDIPEILSPGKAKKLLAYWKSIQSYAEGSEEGAAFFKTYHKELLRNKRLVTMRTDALPLSLEQMKIRMKPTPLQVLEMFGPMPASVSSLSSQLNRPKLF
jgi:5'-3' exonuclease